VFLQYIIDNFIILNRWFSSEIYFERSIGLILPFPYEHLKNCCVLLCCFYCHYRFFTESSPDYFLFQNNAHPFFSKKGHVSAQFYPVSNHNRVRCGKKVQFNRKFCISESPALQGRCFIRVICCLEYKYRRTSLLNSIRV